MVNTPIHEATRKAPFAARVTENTLLSGPGSSKRIRHIVIDITGSDIEVAPGDGIAVHPINEASYVSALIQRLGARGDELIDGTRLTHLLTHTYEIVKPTRPLTKQLAAKLGHEVLNEVVAGDDPIAIDAFMHERDILDLLNLAPDITFNLNEFVAMLKPLKPRVYSVASCPQTYPGEVHLMVSAVAWEHEGRTHKGVCSHHLCEHCTPGELVTVHPVPNRRFRIPDEGSTPTIMIGPGTGLAPFIGFLQQRHQRGDSGANWLFFGDRNEAHDFVYRDQLEHFQRNGVLTRLDTAFSRDQPHKVYVQHRMAEHGADLYAQLEAGAILYVCGDATHMMLGVHNTLHKVIATWGEMSDDEAHTYIEKLRADHRYRLDVY